MSIVDDDLHRDHDHDLEITMSQCHNVTMSQCHDVTMSRNLMSPNPMLSCCDVEMLRCHVEMLRCHVVVGYHEIMVWECVISGCILCGVFLWCIFGIPVFSLACYFAYFGIP